MKKLKVKNTLKLIAAVLVTASMLFSAACGSSDIVKSSKDDKQTVMTIGNYDVSRELFQYFLMNYAYSISNDESSEIDWTIPENASELKESVMASLYDIYGVLAVAKEYGITPDSSTVKQQTENEFASYLASYADEEAFRSDLMSMNMTDSVLKFILSAMECSEQLFYTMINNGEIPSDNDEIMKIMKTDELIRVRQIFIEKSHDSSDADKLALIQSLHDRAVNGEDFGELIDEYGNDWQMFSNPDGAYITKYQNLIPFEKAAFSLGINEISDVVETTAGYSVILRLEKEEDYINEHFDDLYSDIQNARFSEIIESKITALEGATDEKNAFSIYSPSSFSDHE